jgi:hypothetical protein
MFVLWHLVLVAVAVLGICGGLWWVASQLLRAEQERQAQIAWYRSCNAEREARTDQ